MYSNLFILGKPRRNDSQIPKIIRIHTPEIACRAKVDGRSFHPMQDCFDRLHPMDICVPLASFSGHIVCLVPLRQSPRVLADKEEQRSV